MPIFPVLLDFESRSRADLDTVGGRLYWGHASTEALCCAWHDTRTGERNVWLPGDPWPHRGRVLAAHNASGFDRFAWERLGWGEGLDYIDTSELARIAGMPGALEALAKRWGGTPKDKEASAFTKSLSSCRRPSKGEGKISAADWKVLSDEQKRELGAQPEITQAVMDRVIPYNLSDVRVMAEHWARLEPWLDVDVEASRVSRIVNDRGVHFDRELAQALLDCDRANSDAVCKDVAEQLWSTPEEVRRDAKSTQKFCAITGAPNAQALTVATLDHPLARARMALASIVGGKLDAGLALSAHDSRLRDMFRYYGAHTGRWSGSGMQLQNLPRPNKRYEEWSCEGIARLADIVRDRKYVADQDEIDLLIRACICASPGNVLVAEDFASVEARWLVWMANDVKALEAIAAGRDSYKLAAASIYGVPYDAVTKPMRSGAGKIADLACGYQGGANAIIKMSKGLGIDLASLPVTPQEIVAGWRKLHAPCVRLWGQFRDAWSLAMCGGEESTVAGHTFVPSADGRDVAVFLLSGRPIVYNEARYYTYVNPFSGEVEQVLGYQGPTEDKSRLKVDVNGTLFVGVYGGILTENIDQADCRDVMAEALVTAERDGLNPVLTVHDEIACDVPRDAAKDAKAHLHRIMTTTPEWCKGFPIGAAGFVGERYRK